MDLTPTKTRSPVIFGVGETLPVSGDPSWRRSTRPLFNFIFEADRTIVEIIAWGAASSLSGTMTRQMLAWLSLNDVVHYDAKVKLWKLDAEPRNHV